MNLDRVGISLQEVYYYFFKKNYKRTIHIGFHFKMTILIQKTFCYTIVKQANKEYKLQSFRTICHTVQKGNDIGHYMRSPSAFV